MSERYGYPSEMVTGLPAEADERLWDDPHEHAWRMPFSVWAEDHFLGMVLRGRPALTAAIIDLVDPEEFYWDYHGRVLTLARELHAEEAPVTTDSLAERLRERGEWEGTAWEERLNHLDRGTVGCSVTEAEYYARVIRERARLRRIWDLRGVVTELLERGVTADAAEEEITRYLTARRAREASEPTDMQWAVGKEIARINERRETPTLKFGLPAIDRLTQGLEAGEVGVVCGQPGSGKTCFTLMQALHAAETWGPTLVISLEMGRNRLADRLLAMHTDFSFHEIRCGVRRDGEPFADQDRIALADACERLGPQLARIQVDCESYGLEALIASVRRFRLLHGIEAVLVDYGQLVSANAQARDRWQELGAIARALKNRVAVPFHVPVWCLVQPNQESKKLDKDGRPRLLQPGDMFGGMEWEAVANQVWFLNRDPKAPLPEPGVIEPRKPILLHVHKSRDGGTGMVPLMLLGERFRFVERTDRYGEPEGY